MAVCPVPTRILRQKYLLAFVLAHIYLLISLTALGDFSNQGLSKKTKQKLDQNTELWREKYRKSTSIRQGHTVLKIQRLGDGKDTKSSVQLVS